MNHQFYPELFEESKKAFKEYFLEEINEKIFFSGKYGVGKTTFLKTFFSDKVQGEIFGDKEYEIYAISPVHYTISSNEDVLQYIKYDIIYELLRKQKAIADIEKYFKDVSLKYFKKNYHKVFACLISMIPILGKDVLKSFEYIDKEKDNFLRYLNSELENESDKLINFIENLESTKGSIFQNDIATVIINKTLESDSFKSVLIIDDLDRLDPEHIFRILNVFGLHFQNSTLFSSVQNKFSFDKIIFVADFNNLRTIYNHRFGQNVDFHGYIDKFFSRDVFLFDNTNSLRSALINILNTIVFDKRLPKENSEYYRMYFDDKFLVDIICDLLAQKIISLRRVINLKSKYIYFHKEKFYFTEIDNEIYIYSIPILYKLKFLKELFTDFKEFKNAISNLEITDKLFNNYKLVFEELIIVLSLGVHNFNKRKSYVYNFEGTPIYLEFLNEHDEFYNRVCISYAIKNETSQEYVKGGEINITKDLFQKCLIKCIDYLYLISYLK